MTPGPRAFLVDASIYIFRAWFSMPDRWHNAGGWPLNAVYGYSAFLLDILQAPDTDDYCCAAFDESLGTCFRNDIYPGYKASRELPDEALRDFAKPDPLEQQLEASTSGPMEKGLTWAKEQRLLSRLLRKPSTHRRL